MSRCGGRGSARSYNSELLIYRARYLVSLGADRYTMLHNTRLTLTWHNLVQLKLVQHSISELALHLLACKP